MLIELDFRQKCLTILGIVFIGILTSIFLIGNNVLTQLCLIGLLTYLCTGDRPTYCYASYSTLPRDFSAAIKFGQLNWMLMKLERGKMTVAKLFEQKIKQYPNKIAFILDDVQLTFNDVNTFSNKIASYFKQQDYQRGDTITLFMETRVEYPAIWLGLSKLGIVTALINSNLRLETLKHSIKVAKSKAIIVGSELVEYLNEMLQDPEFHGIKIYQYHDKKQRESTQFKMMPAAIDLFGELEKQEILDLSDDIALGTPKDKLVYIYTSGTTGMPKAAVINNLRYMFMVNGANKMLSIRHDDILYNSLPLYHSAGGMVGVGSVLLNGITMVLRRKFSASNFWTDCIKYNCTVAQYIGEICRYLLSVPQKPTDTQHRVRLMFGNGLKAQIWHNFVSRFNIEQIGEFYGSTEGNSNLINTDNTVGAVGFVPHYARSVYPVTLVKCDEYTGEALRNEHGYCSRCKPGEVGVFLGKINPKTAVTAFTGYADKNASAKKIIRNVFKEGDMYFDSGDILVMDLLGYFYFKDRLGDTFRWRGENVATSEVEAVISNVIGLQDCVVYGVEIPHVEGKAGMAAIVDSDDNLNMNTLSISIRGSLPAYARPIFIRILKELPLTGTFKLKKKDLQMEGFNIHKITEPIIYYLDSNGDGVYKRFTEKDYDDVVNGRWRL